MSPKLTLNLGLPYDLVPPPYSVDYFWATLDTSYLGYRLVMPGITRGWSAQPYSTKSKNFAPRIGLAYRLGSKTVIRSGYGVFYETGRHSWFNSSFSVPAYAGTTYDSTNQDDPAMTKYRIDNVWPAAITTEKGTFPVPLGENGGIICERCGASFLDYNKMDTPYTQRWSLDIERALSSAAVVKIGYLGSRGTHLYSFNHDLKLPPEGRYFNDQEYYQARPLTELIPGRWEDLTTVVTDRSNNYHSLSAELQTRLWHGFDEPGLLHVVQTNGQRFWAAGRHTHRPRNRRSVAPGLELRSVRCEPRAGSRLRSLINCQESRSRTVG